MLDSEIIVGYNMVTMKLEVSAMLKISELAMPKSNKVTTVYNGNYPKWIKMIFDVCPDITSGQVCFYW